MIRGWCPSLHEPMATGDGLLVRVKPPLGRVSAAAARALAAAADARGNGVVELTGRGALQFRGLTPSSAARFAATAVALGLAEADPAAERRRSVIVSPLAGLDPAVAPGTAACARALEAGLMRDEALAALPAKFCFAVDGGGALPLGDAADITLVVGHDRCLVVPAGAGLAAPVPVRDAVRAALAMAHAFLALDGTARRMRAVASARVIAAAGLGAIRHAASVPCPAIGTLPGAVGAGVPLGSMVAATLAALADVATRHGDGVLRVTPWRTVLIGGLDDPAVLAGLGLIVDRGHPLLSVSACPGQPSCASATVATRGVAAGLRPGAGTRVHVSGCSKGCAHPGAASLTFVGRDGRFDLVRDGRAGDVPLLRGLAPAALASIR